MGAVTTNIGWSLVNGVARFLQPEEREAVLGDLLETGESTGQALRDVIGLVLRRQAVLWKSWRPWLAAFGLAFPSTFLLMGVSLAVSRGFQQFINLAILTTGGSSLRPGFALLLCNLLLLIGCSWTGGFVVGSLSRRTICVSAALSCLPCLFCLERFRIESLSRFCLLLFVLPAFWGLYRGAQIPRIKLGSAILLAVSVTALTIPAWSGKGPWIPNWALSWPAWYLVATAYKPNWLTRRKAHGQ